MATERQLVLRQFRERMQKLDSPRTHKMLDRLQTALAAQNAVPRGPETAATGVSPNDAVDSEYIAFVQSCDDVGMKPVDNLTLIRSIAAAHAGEPSPMQRLPPGNFVQVGDGAAAAAAGSEEKKGHDGEADEADEAEAEAVDMALFDDGLGDGVDLAALGGGSEAQQLLGKPSTRVCLPPQVAERITAHADKVSDRAYIVNQIVNNLAAGKLGQGGGPAVNLSDLVTTEAVQRLLQRLRDRINHRIHGTPMPTAASTTAATATTTTLTGMVAAAVAAAPSSAIAKHAINAKNKADNSDGRTVDNVEVFDGSTDTARAFNSTIAPANVDYIAQAMLKDLQEMRSRAGIAGGGGGTRADEAFRHLHQIVDKTGTSAIDFATVGAVRDWKALQKFTTPLHADLDEATVQAELTKITEGLLKPDDSLARTDVCHLVATLDPFRASVGGFWARVADTKIDLSDTSWEPWKELMKRIKDEIAMVWRLVLQMRQNTTTKPSLTTDISDLSVIVLSGGTGHAPPDTNNVVTIAEFVTSRCPDASLNALTSLVGNDKPTRVALANILADTSLVYGFLHTPPKSGTLSVSNEYKHVMKTLRPWHAGLIVGVLGFAVPSETTTIGSGSGSGSGNLDTADVAAIVACILPLFPDKYSLMGEWMQQRIVELRKLEARMAMVSFTIQEHMQKRAGAHVRCLNQDIHVDDLLAALHQTTTAAAPDMDFQLSSLRVVYGQELADQTCAALLDLFNNASVKDSAYGFAVVANKLGSGKAVSAALAKRMAIAHAHFAGAAMTAVALHETHTADGAGAAPHKYFASAAATTTKTDVLLTPQEGVRTSVSVIYSVDRPSPLHRVAVMGVKAIAQDVTVDFTNEVKMGSSANAAMLDLTHGMVRCATAVSDAHPDIGVLALVLEQMYMDRNKIANWDVSSDAWTLKADASSSGGIFHTILSGIRALTTGKTWKETSFPVVNDLATLSVHLNGRGADTAARELANVLAGRVEWGVDPKDQAARLAWIGEASSSGGSDFDWRTNFWGKVGSTDATDTEAMIKSLLTGLTALYNNRDSANDNTSRAANVQKVLDILNSLKDDQRFQLQVALLKAVGKGQEHPWQLIKRRLFEDVWGSDDDFVTVVASVMVQRSLFVEYLTDIKVEFWSDASKADAVVAKVGGGTGDKIAESLLATYKGQLKMHATCAYLQRFATACLHVLETIELKHVKRMLGSGFQQLLESTNTPRRVILATSLHQVSSSSKTDMKDEELVAWAACFDMHDAKAAIKAWEAETAGSSLHAILDEVQTWVKDVVKAGNGGLDRRLQTEGYLQCDAKARAIKDTATDSWDVLLMRLQLDSVGAAADAAAAASSTFAVTSFWQESLAVDVFAAFDACAGISGERINNRTVTFREAQRDMFRCHLDWITWSWLPTALKKNTATVRDIVEQLLVDDSAAASAVAAKVATEVGNSTWQVRKTAVDEALKKRQPNQNSIDIQKSFDVMLDTGDGSPEKIEVALPFMAFAKSWGVAAMWALMHRRDLPLQAPYTTLCLAALAMHEGLREKRADWVFTGANAGTSDATRSKVLLALVTTLTPATTTAPALPALPASDTRSSAAEANIFVISTAAEVARFFVQLKQPLGMHAPRLAGWRAKASSWWRADTAVDWTSLEHVVTSHAAVEALMADADRKTILHFIQIVLVDVCKTAFFDKIAAAIDAVAPMPPKSSIIPTICDMTNVTTFDIAVKKLKHEADGVQGCDEGIVDCDVCWGGSKKPTTTTPTPAASGTAVASGSGTPAVAAATTS